MTASVLLGLDVGTTSFKAVACTASGVELCTARLATPWSVDGDGTYMTASDVGREVDELLAKCLRKAGNPQVLGVGVTGMAEAGFRVGGDGTVLTPAYAWQDGSGVAEARLLESDFGTSGFGSVTGLPVTTRCSVVKSRWLARGGSRRGVSWQNLPEWVAGYLGGLAVPEQSLAARTGLLDLHTQNWRSELLDFARLDPGAMPQPANAGTPCGRVPSDRGRLGGAVLTVAGHDHVCASLGANACGPADAFDSLGTGEAVLRSPIALPNPETVSKAVENGLTVGLHVIPAAAVVMAGLGMGARLARVLRSLGVDHADRGGLDGAAFQSPSVAAPGWVVEVLEGASDVSVDPQPAVNLFDAPVLWRSALEFAAVCCCDALSTLAAFAGPANRLVGAGGWFHSEPVRAIRAQILGPIQVSAVREATGYGAALAAGVAAGVFELSHVPTQDQSVIKGDPR